MLTRFRDFVVKNKLYVGIGGVALALCVVVAVVFGVLAGQPSGLPVDNNSVLSSQESGSDAVSSSPEESGAADPSGEGSTTGGTTGADSSGGATRTKSTTKATGNSANQAIIGHTIYPADTSKNGYNTYNIVGVDNLGRTFSTLSSEKSGKQVGIFAAAAEGNGEPELAMGIYDNSKILAMPNGLKLLTDPKSYNSDISPVWQPHFWAEPVWGYYRGRDKWVIRRQLEMMAIANIDFIVYDVSNGVNEKQQNFEDPNNNSYAQIMKTVEELTAEGWKVPKIAFYTHSRSSDVVRMLYNKLYKKGLYKNAWYMVNGKPFIVGYTNLKDEIEEADSRGDTSYKPTALSSEIMNFFSWREAQWPQETFRDNGFPWMEWSWPAPIHNGVINVTTAAHPGVPMSFSVTRPGWINWGRGWDPRTKKNVSANVDKGSFYQDTWDTVFKNQDKVNTVFIGEWNEWCSMKQMWDGEYMFADEFNAEYSRDIEPMIGGFEDNFYMQTIQNIRKFKGNSGGGSGTKKTIDIRANANQWKDVATIYRSIGTTGLARDSYGASDVITYKQDAPRNNLQEVKMANDGENVYLYIRSEKAITAYDGKSSNWMNILIGTGSVGSKGWEGYEYIVNRSPKNTGKTSVEKLDASGKTSSAGTAEYTVDGNVMQVKIPLSVLGGNAKKGLYIKVADNVEKPTDMMSYYNSGKSLPLGRVSYQYAVK